MADEVLKRDENRVTVAGGVTSDTQEIRMFRVDSNGRIKISVTGGAPGSGDVTGPASSTDTAIARFSGTTGKIIQNSGWIISDTDVMGSATSTAKIGLGTLTPISKIDVLSTALGVTQDDTKGLTLMNTTAAALGAQQISPGIVWWGQGWKTAATSASQTILYRAYLLPVQGVNSATGNWILQVSNNGGAYEDRLRVGPDGILISPQSGFSGSVVIGNFSITNASAIALYTAAGLTILGGHKFQLNNPFSATSGTQYAIENQGGFAPTSGTAIFASLALTPTVNQTGGANGITRGLYINPTLTAASEWRPIDASGGVSYLTGLYSTLQIQVAGAAYINNNAAFSVGNGGIGSSSGTFRGFQDLRGFVPSTGSPIYNSVEVTTNFAPTGGSAVFNGLNVMPIINQTGGSNGTVRGFYFNPTLTALVGSLNAIEITAGTAITAASVAARSGFRLPHGVDPTSPVDGDMWTTSSGLFVRINGVTKTVTLT